MVTIRPASAASRSGKRRLAAMEHAVEIDRQHLAARASSVTLAKGALSRGAGIVDQDRDRALRLAGGGEGARRPASRSVTSAGATSASKSPAPTSSSGSRRRPTRVSFAPSAASARAIAAPMPVPPPVTSAWWPREPHALSSASRCQVAGELGHAAEIGRRHVRRRDNPGCAAARSVHIGSIRCGRASATRSARPAARIELTWSGS